MTRMNRTRLDGEQLIGVLIPAVLPRPPATAGTAARPARSPRAGRRTACSSTPPGSTRPAAIWATTLLRALGWTAGQPHRHRPQRPRPGLPGRSRRQPCGRSTRQPRPPGAATADEPASTSRPRSSWSPPTDADTLRHLPGDRRRAVPRRPHSAGDGARMAADPDRLAAAWQALAELGVTLADLQTDLDRRPAVPTVAAYMPQVVAAAGPGARRTYGPYWDRMIAAFGRSAARHDRGQRHRGAATQHHRDRGLPAQQPRRPLRRRTTHRRRPRLLQPGHRRRPHRRRRQPRAPDRETPTAARPPAAR